MADEAPVQERVDALFDEPEVQEAPVEEPVEEPTEEISEEPTEEPEGDEPTEEAEQAETPAEEDLVEVEFEGQIFEAPKAIAEALMRTGDYTQKTQELSTQRKELEVQHDNLRRVDSQYKFALSVQDDVMKAHQLEQQIEQARVYMRENIDGMSHTDLEKIRMAIDETRLERDRIISSVTTKNTEFQQANEQSLKELMDKGTEVLQQNIPGWGKEQQGQVRAFALSSGFTEAEIGNLVDPRQVEILWKASQFDSLQAGKSAAVKKVVSTPSIKAKSRNPMPQEGKDKLKLRKTLKSSKLSSKAKARAIEKSFGERFG